MAFFTAKVPVAVATGVICLLVGGGLGAAIMSYSLGDPKSAAAATGDEEGKDAKKGGDAKGAKGGGGMGGGGMPGGKGGGGGGGGGKGGGGKGGGGGPPSEKAKLTQLVSKLDTLTSQTLHIDLTPDQKKQVKELLADLAEKEAITEEDAKAKLEALLKLLDDKKKTLDEAGYGQGVGGAGPANPFKEGDGAARLKALQATLGK